MSRWGDLDFSVSPTANSATDWPDAASDKVLTLGYDGTVLKPRNPFFSAIGYAGTGSVPQTGLYNWQFTNIQVNEGNHFNNSTGYFTCPVAGRYAVMAMHNFRNSGGSWSSLYILQNSTTKSESWQSSALNETWTPISASHILSCAANDTISLAWHSSYSAPGSGGSRGNALAIWLIG